MRDDFQHSSSAITGPATRHFQIIPGANDLDVRPRAIRCDVAGTATIVDDAGTSIAPEPPSFQSLMTLRVMM